MSQGTVGRVSVHAGALVANYKGLSTVGENDTFRNEAQIFFNFNCIILFESTVMVWHHRHTVEAASAAAAY